MKVLCLLALLTTANGNSLTDFSEIINEIFGAHNFTSVATSNDRNSTDINTDIMKDTGIDTRHSELNFTNFATLRKTITQKSMFKSKSRLRIAVTNFTANLCNYTKEYLQTLLGDWTLIKFYARVLPDKLQLRLFSNCIQIRLAPSKGICKCHGKQLPVFNVAITCKNPKIKHISDVAVAFVTDFKDALKFGNKMCQCKRTIVAGRVLSDDYIVLYDNFVKEMDLSHLVVLARNGSGLRELEKLEETAPELINRKQAVLCEGIVFYTTLKSDESFNKSNSKKRNVRPLNDDVRLSSLSFFDYLNVIPRDKMIEIAFSSSVPI